MRPPGIGCVFVPTLLPFLREAGNALSVVEVEPQTLWELSRAGGEPDYRLNRRRFDELVALPYYKLAHSVGMPVGGSRGPEAAQVRLLRSMLPLLGSPWASDHLSFNAFLDDEGWKGAGFFLPPRQTADGVQLAARNLRSLAAELELPIAFETGVNYLRPRRDELSDGAYFSEVAAAADCGILLDLHNLWVNECNGRCKVDDVIAALPLERIWEIHVAGGTDYMGHRLDAHSGAVPDAVWELAATWIPQMPNLGALIFEVLDEHAERLGTEGVRNQLEQMRRLWMSREPTKNLLVSSPAGGFDQVASQDVPRAIKDWEATLGRLAIGWEAPSDLAATLQDDPGVGLFRHLVLEARSGLIAIGLRHTTTLLLLTLGSAAVERLISAFAAETAPELYAVAESDAFASFLARQALRIPFLDEVLGLEHALIRAAFCGQTTTVAFTHDPAEVLSCLERGRLPDECASLCTQVVISAAIAAPAG